MNCPHGRTDSAFCPHCGFDRRPFEPLTPEENAALQRQLESDPDAMAVFDDYSGLNGRDLLPGGALEQIGEAAIVAELSTPHGVMLASTPQRGGKTEWLRKAMEEATGPAKMFGLGDTLTPTFAMGDGRQHPLQSAPMKRVERRETVDFYDPEAECSTCGHTEECHSRSPCDGIVAVPDGTERPCDCRSFKPNDR